MSHLYLETSSEAVLHRQAFLLCVSDLRKAFEYVEGHDRNLEVFSHRFYELLLRSCTEFESLAKTILEAHGRKLKKPTISDYFALVSMYQLRECHAILLEWNPDPLILSPFLDWKNTKTGPSWYRAYNGVKHSRRAKFEEANLKNVLLSLSAILALLVQGYRPNILGSRASRIDENRVETVSFPKIPFMLSRPGSA